MSLIVYCPYCGQKLCRAEEGSKVALQCPKCKADLDLIVSDEAVKVGKVKKDRVVKAG